MNRYIAAILPLALMAGSALASNPLATARVAQGVLAGRQDGGSTAFLGIPFAAPPVGENRWRPPSPAKAWHGIRQADHFSASCMQSVDPKGFGPWTHEYVTSGAVSEDCLYLNVWTPAARPGAKLPVLVWIYGGGFSSGSSSVPIYDGAALARKGIVVASLNYRVGLFGFLAHPGLSAESPAHASGNYGLMDQAAALRWVHDNIAAFGGDPSKVTIAGQSAGAASVHHLIASPMAHGLFARAIAQSGSGMGIAVPDLPTTERGGVALGAAAGAATIAALRSMTAADLMAAARKLPASGVGLSFAPNIDGLFLPAARYAGANTNDTPILTGMTADEMTGLNPNFGKATTASFDTMIAATYGALAPELRAAYPASTDSEANAQAGALARDRGLASMAAWASERQRTSRQPVFAYLWTHSEPGPDAARYRAFHSSEIPYVFGTLDTAPERSFTAVDRTLSALLGDYWVNWVRQGDPNGPGLPAWPLYTPASPRIAIIGDGTVEPAPVLPPAKAALFGKVVANGGRLSLF